ncbi:MAG: SAVED domain-containing protein [Acidimicrobiales bacterium]|nr:SAVED domain-containing protein [Acidimicrobiales bacterium]
MSQIPGRSSSGVRIAGDDYQHLVTWNEVLNALGQNSDVMTITVEAPDAGNVDDVVIRRRSGSHRYIQVKHAVDATTPVGTDWLMHAPGDSRSLLQKFHRSWVALSGDGRQPELVLVTDREIDPVDPVMRLLDRRSSLLVPDIGRPAARAGREAWAEHLAIDETELVAFLGSLEFLTGRYGQLELERASTLMWAHGLNDDQAAFDRAMAFVREWVMERDREVDVEMLQDQVTDRIGKRSDPGAIVVIEAIDDDSHPDDADLHIRFVERYDGDVADRRRQLLDPTEWAHISAELEGAGERVRDQGHRRVLVRGAMRLPVWFGAGAAFRHVHGFEVAGEQGGSLWASDDLQGIEHQLNTEVTAVGRGDELAVAIGLAADPGPAVRRYLEESALPVSRLAVMCPTGGVRPNAVEGSAAAASLALSAINETRALLESEPAGRIHLFLATPGVFAMLLGHRWNGMRETVVHEHLGIGRGYAPSIAVHS